MPIHDIAKDATQFSKCNIECDPLNNPNEKIFVFRRYWVIPSARQLLLGTRTITLGGRAFDLLIVLLQARGQILSKEEIMSLVWPSTTVDECNLRFQMTALRKALGEDRDVIKTVPGRGYLFAAENDQDAIAKTPIVSSRRTETLPPHFRPTGPAAWTVPDARLILSGTSNGSKPASTAGQDEVARMASPTGCGHDDLALQHRRVLDDAHVSDLGKGATARRINDLEAEIIRLKLVISALTLGQLQLIMSDEPGPGVRAGR